MSTTILKAFLFDPSELCKEGFDTTLKRDSCKNSEVLEAWTSITVKSCQHTNAQHVAMHRRCVSRGSHNHSHD